MITTEVELAGIVTESGIAVKSPTGDWVGEVLAVPPIEKVTTVAVSLGLLMKTVKAPSSSLAGLSEPFGSVARTNTYALSSSAIVTVAVLLPAIVSTVMSP